MWKRLPAVFLVLLPLALLPGCGGGASSAGGGSHAPTRVAVVVLENHEVGDILGDPRAPYLSSLAQKHAVATSAFALAHPSLPNYIALVTGRTAGITTDCVPSDCSVKGPSLVDQLEAHRISWRGYMESMPKPCFHFSGDELGRYAQRHNPFAYLPAVWSRPERCQKVVPFSELHDDMRHGMPRFSWITPNLCHDMHDCGIAAGDNWLRRTVPPLLRALGPNGVLILTFDEGTTDEGCCNAAHGGQIATILAGEGARRLARDDQAVDHYSTLATVETLLGLPKLGDSRSAPTLTALVTGAATAAAHEQQ
jgi:phosphatidylinositol-3-phosphatase